MPGHLRHVITLWPHQQHGVDAIRGAFGQNIRNVLYCLPTGGGKTVIFCYIAANAAARGTLTIVAMHRRELIKQTCDALKKFNVRYGVIAPDVPKNDALIQVASVQTLIRRREWDGWAALLVTDEAHHAVSPTYRTVRDRQPDAFALGVTATPCRMSGRGLATVFDTLIQGPPYSALIRERYLTPARVFAPSTVDTDGLLSRCGDYQRDAVSNLMMQGARRITGDAIEHYRRLADGVPAVAFCASVAHAEQVATDFERAGYSSASVDGSLFPHVRDARIRGLADGSVQVLTSCDLISEGVDIPSIGCAIFLRPTRSTSLWMQMAGRALRAAPGKQHAIILDHVGNTHRLGLPDADRDWTLDDGAKTRTAAELPACAKCPTCYATHYAAPVCPYCGHVYESAPIDRTPKSVAGVLVEINGELLPRTKENVSAAFRDCKTSSEFVETAVRLGYDAKYGLIRYRMKTGQFFKGRRACV